MYPAEQHLFPHQPATSDGFIPNVEWINLGPYAEEDERYIQLESDFCAAGDDPKMIKDDKFDETDMSAYSPSDVEPRLCPSPFYPLSALLRYPSKSNSPLLLPRDELPKRSTSSTRSLSPSPDPPARRLSVDSFLVDPPIEPRKRIYRKTSDFLKLSPKEQEVVLREKAEERRRRNRDAAIRARNNRKRELETKENEIERLKNENAQLKKQILELQKEKKTGKGDTKAK